METNLEHLPHMSRLNKFCEKQPLKNLLSPLLNTLSHIFFVVIVVGVLE